MEIALAKTVGVSEAEAVGPDEPGAAECGLPGAGPGHAGWFWGEPSDGPPADAPLHVLLLAASRIMGAFYAGTLAQAGLRISPAGLGVLRVLLAVDGLKSSDVAARGWSSPGTLTSVVNTLVPSVRDVWRDYLGTIVGVISPKCIPNFFYFYCTALG